MLKIDCKVKVLCSMDAKYLEELIIEMLEDGYSIQSSQISWYCGRIDGVYVFIKEEQESDCSF